MLYLCNKMCCILLLLCVHFELFFQSNISNVISYFIKKYCFVLSSKSCVIILVKNVTNVKEAIRC